MNGHIQHIQNEYIGIDSTELMKQNYIPISSTQYTMKIGAFDSTSSAEVFSYTEWQPPCVQTETPWGENERIVPIISREELKQILLELEQKYQISSEEFYNLWLSGKAPDRIDTLKWIILWEAWREGYLLL